MNQTTSVSSTLSAEAISNRAYELWEKEGRREGNDQHYWFLAEQELREAAQRDGSANTKPATPTPNSDVTPLKGTRAAAAVESSAARSSSAAPTAKSSGKRASASPFAGSSQKK